MVAIQIKCIEGAMNKHIWIKVYNFLKEQFIYIIFGIVIGLLSGVSSWAFLEALHFVTNYRIEHNWLLYFLPIAGFLVASSFYYLGGKSILGNALLLDEIHSPTQWIPRRMSILVFFGTVTTHLFGGSVGREGAALQMSGSLSDAFSRLIKVKPDLRRIILIASLAGGFGSVFGVPFAGIVFTMEVQSIGKLRFKALLSAIVASFTGDKMVEVLGYRHSVRQQIKVNLDFSLIFKLAIAGIIFGLASIVFIELTHIISKLTKIYISYSPFRTFVGGLLIVFLALVFGRQYLGLSLNLIDNAFVDKNPTIWIPILKIFFTAICLGCAFPGGEVTPLFVIGATLGAFLALLFGAPALLFVSLGFVAVFSGAANTPLACCVMAVEIFGVGIFIPVVIICLMTFIFSNHRGIYMPHHVVKSNEHKKSDVVPKIIYWSRIIVKGF